MHAPVHLRNTVTVSRAVAVRFAREVTARGVQCPPAMIMKTTITALVAMALGCGGSKDSEPSKPVTCDKAGTMVAKRMGEYADEAKVAGPKRVELDKAMAAAITTRCTEDKWDEVALGCLGAMATIPDGKIDAPTYNKGVDICTKAIGEEKSKALDTAVGEAVRTTMKTPG